MRTSSTAFFSVSFVLVVAGCSSSDGDSGSGSAAGGQGAAFSGTGSTNGTSGAGTGLVLGGAGTATSGGGNGVGSTGAGTVAGGAGTGTGTSTGVSGCRTCATGSCGLIDDGCGNFIDCGQCASGICGAVTPGVCSSCTPITCASKGANCGFLSDGCGQLLNCGTCATGLSCGFGGANICGDPGAGPGDPDVCENFCLQQDPSCAATSLTTVKGTVFAPSGYPALKPERGEAPLPLPNAVVYVPNGSTSYPYGLAAFKDGVADGVCSCEIQGSPLIQTTTNTDGSFTLTDVPVGQDIPLVIQLGRWRRLITIPQVTACTTIDLDAEMTRLPRTQGEGNGMDSIPKMALTTGAVDALECVFRKMGVEDTQFSNAGGTGRIQFYRDNGSNCSTGGGSCTGTTPGIRTLTANQATIDGYDAVLYPCKGQAHDEPAADKSRVLDIPSNANAYVNKGGRAYFTHYSYAWLYSQQPSTALPWPSKTVSRNVNTDQWDPAVHGAIDTSFERGQTFRDWLGLPVVNALAATTPVPYIDITESRRDLDNPANWEALGLPAQRWIYTYNNQPKAAMLHVTFDTPWGLPAAQQCGRVLYSSFHVTTADLPGGATDTTDFSFPAECTTTFSAQEKVLAFMMFDMTSCVQPPPRTCTPLTCADQQVTCGPAGDGCGNQIDCGLCCQPTTCSAAGHTPPNADPSMNCKYPDGCGSTITCECEVG